MELTENERIVDYLEHYETLLFFGKMPPITQMVKRKRRKLLKIMSEAELQAMEHLTAIELLRWLKED